MPMILDSPPPERVHDPAEELRRVHHEAEVIVVGAGILGSALAVTLARQGRSVILLEKSLKEPDRIVGELLQPGGVEALEKLGLRDCLEDIDAIPVQGYEVYYYGSGVNIPYPENADDTPRKRPEGRSFHHGRLIRRLREKAMLEQNITVVETTATEVVKCDYTGQVLGVRCDTKGQPDYYFGPLTIISDGYASTFRKTHLQKTPTSTSKFYGLELLNASLPHPNHGHVILTHNAPVLLYQISSQHTRALVDVPTNTPTASVAAGGVKSHLREVVLPSLPECVRPSFSAALEEGKLRSMPNSFLPPSVATTPGLALLGDAMNMRHPLTGGGMTVAFNDVVLLSTLLSPSSTPSLTNTTLVLRQLKSFHWRRKQITSVINILAQALYALFAAGPEDARLRALQRGCFRYFQRGGECVDGPAGLLAGVIRRPMVLVWHFYCVAVLSLWVFVVEGVEGLTREGEVEEGGLGGRAGRGEVVQKAGKGGRGEVVQKAGQVKSRVQAKGVSNFMAIRAVQSLGVLWTATKVLGPYVLSELRS